MNPQRMRWGPSGSSGWRRYLEASVTCAFVRTPSSTRTSARRFPVVLRSMAKGLSPTTHPAAPAGRVRRDARSPPPPRQGRIPALDVELLDLEGVPLDEGPAGLHLLPHQHGEHLVGADPVLDLHAEEPARGDVHRGVAELGGH